MSLYREDGVLQRWHSRVFSKHFNGSDKGCEKDAEKEVTRRRISAQSMQELSLIVKEMDGLSEQGATPAGCASSTD